MTVDSLGFGDGAVRAARAARGRARGRRARSPGASLPDAADVRPHRHARHGRLRHRRRRAAGGRHRDAAGAGHRAQALPHARVRRRRARSRSRCRTRATPRRRSRWRAARSPPAPRSSRSRAAASWRALAQESRLAARAVPRRHPDAARSRSARWSRRCSSCCSAWACCPRRTPASCARRSSSRTRRDQCKPDGRRRAQPGARAGAQDRPHDPDHLRQRRPRRRRRAAVEAVDATRTPRRPRSGTSTPSSTTTRSAAGASTATSPARCSRWSSCATASSTRGSSARGRATRELIEEALCQVLTVEAEGEGRLAQLLDLDLPRRLDELLPRARQRRRPRPHRRHRAAQGRARLRHGAPRPQSRRDFATWVKIAQLRRGTSVNATRVRSAWCTRATGARGRSGRRGATAPLVSSSHATGGGERRHGDAAEVERAEVGRPTVEVGGAVGARARGAVGPAVDQPAVRCWRGGSSSTSSSTSASSAPYVRRRERRATSTTRTQRWSRSWRTRSRRASGSRQRSGSSTGRSAAVTVPPGRCRRGSPHRGFGVGVDGLELEHAAACRRRRRRASARRACSARTRRACRRRPSCTAVKKRVPRDRGREQRRPPRRPAGELADARPARCACTPRARRRSPRRASTRRTRRRSASGDGAGARVLRLELPARGERAVP